ncbi:nucleotidyltransferase family protein [Pseudoxanthomonas sp. PXM03]|jgi:D-glycero-alpha-D-manno-heptose 1-phosphate guanylyltransferase|uniref:nucleotidyltransferase family protein n=1 Tax=Pseudoxanthomonas sp. PXM03 TaxID=2769284 RepID=UPI0017869368|nr:nucleotidyltransferase family protein [Pseudoxanthomonas sp. PXM03]MBD9435072.1 nucleotidyltransferase family protein [Pseudoxanthomonas sp. PXM03]
MRSDEAIVLAGGFGTRLRTLVSEVPKPMAPVAGRPFLEWILRRLEREGMRRVVLATGYMAEKIEQVFGGRFGDLELVHSVETQPLGTGGAIALAAEHVGDFGVHVINGDTYLDYTLTELEALAREHGSIGMALARVDDVCRYGAVGLEGAHVRRFHEKGAMGPGWINAGCYYLPDETLRALPAGSFSFESDVLAPRAEAGLVVGMTDTDGFIDIGVPEDYLRSQSLFGAEP